MSIRASTFSCEITPDEGSPLFGHPGQKRVSTGIHDPLMVSAIHLRGGSGGIIVISLDLFTLSPSFVTRLRQEIEKATGTKEQYIFIGTSQNRSGPVSNHALCRFSDPSYSEPDSEYMDYIVDRTVHAASEAVVASRPAAAAAFTLDKPGTGAILLKDTVYGKVLGLIVIYPEKASFLGKENAEISADFIGILRKKLTKSFGGTPAIAYFVAPSTETSSNTNQDASGKDAANEAGIKLAKQIVSKIKELTNDDFSSSIAISGKLSEAPLKRRNLSDGIEAHSLLSTMSEMHKESEQDDQKENIPDDWKKLRTRQIVNLIAAQKKGVLDEVLKHYVNANIHLIQLGSIKILGMPCSVSPEAGRKIIESSDDLIWIAENVNGELQDSLLTTNEKNDNYTLLSALFESEAGDALVNTALAICK